LKNKNHAIPYKNILNGLGGAVYGGEPHGVPEALQSVNTENTSGRRKEGVRVCECVSVSVCIETQTYVCVHDMSASTDDVGHREQIHIWIENVTRF